MPMNRRETLLPRAGLAAGALLAGLLTAAHAQAQPLPQPANVMGLSASASAELPRDWLVMTLSTTREGPDAATVQTQLKQALDAALAEARRAARPGQVEVQTGNFSLFPRYAQRGVISGWAGTAELVISGRDAPAIAALSGRVGTMTIGRVSWALSREAREKVEAEVVAQAIAGFRAKAEAWSRQFGFSGFAIREVQVGGIEPEHAMPAMAMAAPPAGRVAADVALPVEAGKAVVTATVSGTVQMLK